MFNGIGAEKAAEGVVREDNHGAGIDVGRKGEDDPQIIHNQFGGFKGEIGIQQTGFWFVNDSFHLSVQIRNQDPVIFCIGYVKQFLFQMIKQSFGSVKGEDILLIMEFSQFLHEPIAFIQNHHPLIALIQDIHIIVVVHKEIRSAGKLTARQICTVNHLLQIINRRRVDGVSL